MSNRRTHCRVCILTAAALVLGAGITAAQAQDDGPNTGKVGISAGLDWTTAYFFRGILQENHGIILQPWAEMGFNLMEDNGKVNSVDLTIGTWHSFHDQETAAAAGSSVDSWYEADLYVGASMRVNETYSLGATFTIYSSPNDAFDTVNDVTISLGHDDSGFWTERGAEGFALNPTVDFIFETDGQADQNGEPAGTDEGIAVIVGIEPSFQPFPNGSLSDITVSVPISAGFSLDDYYEDGMGDDDAFGYADVGIAASMPLPIPSDYGAWNLAVAVHFLFLGGNLEAINSNEDPEIIGSMGVSMEY